MGITGTYKVINGEVIKVSNRPPYSTAKDRWFEKHKLNGDNDRRKYFKQCEMNGTLNKVDDRDVWEPLTRANHKE